MKFVVIGGDAAGLSAASKAKRMYPDLDVIVFEKTFDVSFSACGMPYNIADPLRGIDDLVVRSADVFRNKQGIDLRLNHTVESIDREAKVVHGRSDGKEFSESYDKLLIATGARARSLPLPGMDLPGVLTLRALDDGRAMKRYLAENTVRSAVIVGSGYIGLEMAEALCARGVGVILPEVRTEILPWLPLEMSKLIIEELECKGAQVMLGVDLTEIRRTDKGLQVVTRDSRLDVDMVLIAVGVEPRSELAANAGLALGPYKAIAVDKYLRTSDPNIFAAGDCADAFHALTGARVWIPLGLRANRTGWLVAENLLENKTEAPDIVGTAVFKTFGYEVARTGLSVGEAETAGFQAVDTYIKSRSRAWRQPGAEDLWVQLVADRSTEKLLGGSIVGKEGAAHRIDSIAVALHAGMSVTEFFNCDMAYAPPFGPVWDPMLTCANVLLTNLKKASTAEKPPIMEP